MPGNAPFWLIPLAAPALFLVLSALTPILSGWRTLAQRYPDDDPLRTGPLYTAKVGPIAYKRALRIRPDARGLHIAMPRFLLLFHPPILLPWTALRRLGPEHMMGKDYQAVEVDGVRLLLPPAVLAEPTSRWGASDPS